MAEAATGRRQCFPIHFVGSLIYFQILCLSAVVASDAQNVQNAGMLEMFVDKLPTMPIIQGYTKSDERMLPAHLTIGMYMKKWKFHRDLPSSTVFAFGTSRSEATVPGPTIVARSGVETYVKWENHLPSQHMFTLDHTLEIASPSSGIPTVVHLHGSVSEPPSDGNAQAWFTAGFKQKGPNWKKEVYVYHNARETGNMWYHDHALGYTRLNLLAGLIGAYTVSNPAVEDAFQLPSGKYDQHLVVFDRSFTRSGDIYINSTGDNPSIHPEWQPEYFGDVIIVNGKAWPYLQVARRKYRFRIINASNARFYRFALDNGLQFIQIGSDSFYFAKPVVMNEILVSPSEIIDVVVDFTNSPTNETILTNSAVYPFPGGDPVNEQNGKVMKFMVVGDKPARSDSSKVPKKLVKVEKLQLKDAKTRRNIVMYEFDSATGDPTHLQLNFKAFSEAATEKPKAGTTERWDVINLTPDNHPLHVHLAAFQVVKQQGMNNNTGELAACAVKNKGVEACDLWRYAKGIKAQRAPKNEGGWKNVFKMQPNFITSMLVRFSLLDMKPFPFNASASPGYAYHCHILDHEDNVMMRPFNILP